MIGLDTNVLVRYLAHDHPAQSEQATALIATLSERSPGWISLVTFAELHWVLIRSYRVARRDAVDIVLGLVDAQELHLEQADIVRRAAALAAEGADFADALIAESGRAAGCEHTVTFDRRAADGVAMRLLG